MALFPKKYLMIDITICDRCKDAGYLIGYKRNLTNPNVQEEWKEVCPYCMPTNKYGNLQEILADAPMLPQQKLLGNDPEVKDD